MAGKSLIGALRVTLGLDSAQFTAGTARARKEMTTMQKGAAALKGALVGMIGLETINQLRRMNREALDSVGALGEQAQQIGVNTDVLQQYRYMASQVGIANDEMDKGLQQLVRRLGDAATGNKSQMAAFERLGVAVTDANGKVRDADAVFRDVAEAINKLPTAAEQAAASADVFGARLGQKMLPALVAGKKAVDDYVKSAERMGFIISEEDIKNADKVADQLEENDRLMEVRRNKIFLKHGKDIATLEKSWDDFQIGLIEIGASLVSGAETVTTALDNQMVANHKFLTELWASFSGFNENLIAWGNSVKGIWAASAMALITAKERSIAALAEWGTSAVQWVAKMVSGIKAEVVDRLNAVWKMATDKIDAVKKKFFDLYDAVVGNSYIPDMVDEIGQHMRRLGKEMVDPAVAATKAAGDAFAKMQAKVGAATEIQNVRIVESFSDMTNGVLREVDRLVKGIKSGNFLDIIGGLLGAVDGIAKLFNGGAGLGGLFGGGGTSSGKTGNSTKPPGFASGGAMKLGGFGGVDRNLLSLNGSPLARVSAGETMTITPANDRGGGGPVHFHLEGAVMTDDLLRQMNAIGQQAAVQGARGGANLAMATMARRQARALA